MYADISDAEKQEQIEINDIHLSFTEKRIWSMWSRWRQSEKHLYPWQYMTDTVYADDIIDLEAMESIASNYEKERDRQLDARNRNKGLR